jgi:DNA-binding response OmpR family regulator
MLFATQGRRAPSGAAPFSSSHGLSRAAQPLRVLIAEDDRDTVLTLMMLLREEGHEVRSVHTGRNVMSVVRDFDPDAVILDIHLPELSGWEVARTIRARRGLERPMLIGVSGEYKQGADRILSEILGFDHYLLKPYDPKDLLTLLESSSTGTGAPNR